MAEYIERAALLTKALKEKRFVFQMEDLINNEIVVKTVYSDFAEFVNSIPAADVVERKRGRWIEHDCFKCNSNGEPVIKTGTVFVCSECGREERHREPFCHCGADMREGDQ